VFGWLRKSDPLLFGVAALLAAAVLVVYLQDQALRTLRQQRGVILQTIAERNANAAAREIQRILEAPVFETLSAVNHPLLREGRFDLVAAHYADGLDNYPQVERFFLWTDGTDADARDEVLFFDRTHRRPRGGPALAGFYRDTPTGRAVHALAETHADAQRIYAAVEQTLGGRRYHVLIRLFWVDARRDRFFALLGFLIDLESTRTTLFPSLYEQRLRSLTESAAGSPGFALQVLDETGSVVFGPQNPLPPLAARVEFPLRFYPGDAIDGRLAIGTPARIWSVQVAPKTDDASSLVASLVDDHWLTGLPVLLIVVALGVIVQSKRRASELARMQATFISHVSHQLKTPLSLLSAASESLTFERVRTPAKLARYLAIMRSETARLSALVERVLEFSKLEQGKRVYELEAIDLAPLVRETADAFSEKLAQERFVFTVSVPRAPLLVKADPAAFEQVLVNLLDNAVKYSTEHRVIAVRAGTSGQDAFFEVTDRGIGIVAAEVDRIFDRFYRGSNVSSDRRGFGLGLAIAAEIVRAHRGRIEVQSQPGLGTTFRVSLPILREQRDGVRRPAPVTDLHRWPTAARGGPSR
jgi:signal transduction histidine kinase